MHEVWVGNTVDGVGKSGDDITTWDGAETRRK